MKNIYFWKNFIEKVKKDFKGLDFEIVAMENSSELTRFAKSYIHQNVAETDLSITFKVINQNKVGVVKVNSFDETVISEGIKRAIGLSKIVPELDYQYCLVKPQNYKAKSKSSFYEKTANFTPLNRAQQISKLVKKVNKKEYEASGAFETGMETMMVANSEGVFAFDRKTKVNFNSIITKDNSTAHHSFISSNIDHLDIEGISDELLDTALRNVDQVEIEPGIYTVILSPEAAAEILSEAGYVGFDGKLIMEGKSFISGKQGKKLFPKSITISDDPDEKCTIPIPFDFIGYPRNKIELIKDGVIIDGVYDYLTALKYNRRCTGNTLPPENASMGALPFNLVMKGGEYSSEDMVSNTKNGIYINRFHYVNVLNPMSIELTGMTRDGTFLIENGKITRAIKNMRFNVSVVDLLKGVDMISRERKTKAGLVGPVVAPYLRTNNFTFSSKTSF
ncbi:MAG: TldD/PmbA family protein [Candidatus Caldatribacteriota bacterium]|nr:TldD/PmbA family protein [Candidatus Caldatribacteriota bacterium]